MTQIKGIAVSELMDFVKSSHYKNLSVLPISPQRALSYHHNPRAIGDEMVMFLAYKGERLVGYRITLPDAIYVDGSREQMGWYSCVWVDPSVRGKGVAKAMVEKTLDAWGKRILLQNPVPASEALYRGSGLFPRDNYLPGMRGYFRPEFAHILGSKGGLMSMLKPGWRLLDLLINPLNQLRLSLSPAGRNIRPSSFQVVTEFDESDDAFIEQFDKDDLSRKRSVDLNWWIRYPWVLTGVNDRTSSRYYFSAIDNRFEFVPVRFFDAAGKQNGLILFSIRNRELRTAYCRLEMADLKVVSQLIQALMYELDLATFTTLNAELTRYFGKNSSGFMFKKNIRRLYLVSEVLDNQKVNTDVLRFQDGDGDAAFT